MCLVTNDEEEYDEGNEDKIDSSYGIHGFWASRKILKTATEFLGLGHVTIRAGDCVFFFLHLELTILQYFCRKTMFPPSLKMSTYRASNITVQF